MIYISPEGIRIHVQLSSSGVINWHRRFDDGTKSLSYLSNLSLADFIRKHQLMPELFNIQDALP